MFLSDFYKTKMDWGSLTGLVRVAWLKLNPFLFVLLFTPLYITGQAMQTVVQRGHGRAVKTAITDPENKFIFSGSRDHTIKMWDAESGLEIRSFFGHDHTVNDLDLHGNMLASSSADKTARIWDIDSGKELFKISSKDLMTNVAFHPDGEIIAVGGFDWNMSIWNLRSKTMLKSIKISPEKGLGYGLELVFSPDGKWLVIGEDNQKVKLISTEDWEVKHELGIGRGFCGGCIAFPAFLPDGSLVKVAQKGPVEVWTMNKNGIERKDSIGKNKTEVAGIDVSKEGLLAVAGETWITVIDLRTKDTTAIFETDMKEINQVHFLGKADKGILVAGENSISRLYSMSGEVKNEYSGTLNLSELSGLNYDPSNYWDHYIANWIRLKNLTKLSPNGKELIRGKFGNKVKRWDLWSGKIKREYSTQEKAVLAFDIDSKGERMLVGSGEGGVLIYDFEKGDTLEKLGRSRELLFDVRFSHDEKQAVAVGWDGYVRTFDLEKSEQKPIINLENTSAYCASYTPNDLYLVLAKLDKSLELWEPDTRTMVRKFQGHTDVVSQINFNGQGTRMLTSSWDGSAREWDLSTGLQTQKVRSHGPLYCAVYSPDEQYIVTGGEDRTVKFFDKETGELEGIFEGHKAPITQVLFTDGGKIMVSVDMDGVTKAWDMELNKAVFEQVHIGKNDWMVRTPEGFFTATDGAMRYIHFAKGNQTFKLDQFFDDYYRPDLIRDLRSSNKDRNIKNLDQNLEKNPPPGVKLAVIEMKKGESAMVTTRVIDRGAGVKTVSLYHNSKKLKVLKKPIKTKGDTSYYREEMQLVNGINEFTVIAENKAGFESSPAKESIEVIKGTKDSKCFIFAIGINEYQNPKFNLNYARADANSVIETFEENARDLFSEVQVISLFDSKANKDKILSSLDDLAAKASINDVLVFYYAGHGTVVENRFFFVPHETSRLFDLKSLEETAISAEEMQQRLQSIKALKQIIIMDACQSGGSVELLAQRGAVEEKAIAQLSRSAGIHVMASAGSNQYASEFADLGHGVFTYSLLEALNGAADGAPKDQKVTIYELKSFLDDQVPTKSQQLRGDPQYPYTFSRGNDFPLVIQKK